MQSVTAIETQTSPASLLEIRPRKEALEIPLAEDDLLRVEIEEAPTRRPTSLKRKFNPIVHNSATYQLVSNTQTTSNPTEMKVNNISNETQNKGDSHQQRSSNAPLQSTSAIQVSLPVDAKCEADTIVSELANAVDNVMEVIEAAGPMNVEIPAPPKDVHPGKALVDCYANYFDFKEKQLHHLVDHMDRLNEMTNTLCNLHNALAQAKQTDKKADFSQDPEVKGWIDALHKFNPRLFDPKNGTNLNYQFPNEASIDIAVTALDGQMKKLSADIQRQYMVYGSKLEDRTQMTEQSRQLLKMINDFMESIVRRLTPR